jgi:hypothetical protein
MCLVQFHPAVLLELLVTMLNAIIYKLVALLCIDAGRRECNVVDGIG